MNATLEWSILLPAMVAGLMVLASHVPLGLRVLERGIIFIDIAIAQHPYDIGYEGVKAAVAVINGETVEPSIGTGFTVMNAGNIDDPDVQARIYSE